MDERLERNLIIDVARGIAILMVILGHIITINTIHYEDTILFRTLWSLQIPLFMIISGYVTIYSRQINTIKQLFEYISKRTIAYLVPWLIWTVLIRGVLLGACSLSNIFGYLIYIVWHIDSGYWFLVSLWTICIVYGIGSYLAAKFSHNQIIMTIVFSSIPYIILILVALKIGLSFLGLKFTLYYLPFFYLGYIYSNCRLNNGKYEKLKEILTFVSTVIFICCLVKFNSYTAKDNFINISLRIISSVTGCIMTFATLSSIIKQSILQKQISILSMIGKQTLGLYLIHFLFYSIIKVPTNTNFLTAAGAGYVAINFIIAVVNSYGIVWLLDSNKYLSFLFLGKKKYRISKND